MRITIQFDGEEYRVPGPKGTEAQAYYTDDRQDAYETALKQFGVSAATIKVRKVQVWTL